eukprot:144254-Chlamydomonas_euryale.AAC.8
MEPWICKQVWTGRCERAWTCAAGLHLASAPPHRRPPHLHERRQQWHSPVGIDAGVHDLFRLNLVGDLEASARQGTRAGGNSGPVNGFLCECGNVMYGICERGLERVWDSVTNCVTTIPHTSHPTPHTHLTAIIQPALSGAQPLSFSHPSSKQLHAHTPHIPDRAR